MSGINGYLLYASDEGWGLLFDKQAFFRVGLQNEKRELIVSVHLSVIKGLLSHNRLASRLLRLEPRCAERLDDNRFVVCFANKIWLLDIKKRTFVILQENHVGFSNPLNLCSDGKSVYWGDYGNNPGRTNVKVYRLSADLKVEVVFEFPQRTIRHIHNIIWDCRAKRYYVLTGDLEECSGIYMATENWNDVRPIVTGCQQYRAVTGFPYKNGLVYSTDSVAEKNGIYFLQEDGSVKRLCGFPGSCIYGTETKSLFVFASTVEPPEGRGGLKLFTYKLGAGIQDCYSHLVTVRKRDLLVEEVLKVKKDIWPMRLFQYGTIMFPKGQENGDGLWYYVVACKGDGKTRRIELH